MRPIGGVLLGAYADGQGRKASLMVSIVLMTVGTLAIAIMPSYETIGLLAPIGVLAARLVQGFSAGAEFRSSTAFLVEHMPHRRGFVASWQFANQGLGRVLSSAFGVGLTVWMTTAGLSAWGNVSDRIGRTTHMIAVGLLILVSAFPAFTVLTRTPVPAVILLAVVYLAVLKTIYFGPLAALMSELFPPATRATGLGLSYNIGVTLFGGMAPATITWLGTFALIGDLAPGYYLTVIGVMSLAALIAIRTRGRILSGRDAAEADPACFMSRSWP